MRNLAGETTLHADAHIEDELKEACIPIFKGDSAEGEVMASLAGKHGKFRFKRAWSYWVVNGPVSVELAWELYNDPRGRYDVRVAGHCGCPEPTVPWTTVVDGIDSVTEYHIDSQDGLNLFAEKVLGTRSLPPTKEEKKVALEIARANNIGMIIYEDDLTEEDIIAAQQEVHEICCAITDLHHRLDRLRQGVERTLVPHDSLTHTVAGSLTTAIVTLYSLENLLRAEGETR